MEYLGESAALATAVLWAFTSIFFAEAGRRLGSFRVNVIRLGMAVLLYGVVLLVTKGKVWPEDLNQTQLAWLVGSGFVGLVLGDGCGFKALVMIGPRLTSLLYASTPVFATVVAWIFLGEHLTLWSLLGIGVTLSGITWVVMERRYKNTNLRSVGADHPDAGSLVKGVLLGLGAGLGQAVGLVMAKQGMFFAGGTLEPFEASFVRMSWSFVILLTFAIIRGQFWAILRAFKNGPGIAYSAVGAAVGPFLGVWMSLVAVKYIATGVAATLNAMQPVMVLPLVKGIYREQITIRAVLGAILAVGGSAILFLL